jgi:thioredoxin domain-containing protein 5
LAELINTQDESRVKVAMVNCVDNQATCSANEISGYPTLKFFKQGTTEPIKYRSTRDLPSLTQFINDQLGTSIAEEEAGEKEEPAVPTPQKGVVELTDKNFNQLTENGVWFVKFYAPW